jgi:signal transduction histidine kinase/CheY-like chemotaxis protein
MVVQAVAPLLVTVVLLAYGLRRLRRAIRQALDGQAANLARAREGVRLADLGQAAVQRPDPEGFVAQVVATAADTLGLPAVAAYRRGGQLHRTAAAGALETPAVLELRGELAEVCSRSSPESHTVVLEAAALPATDAAALPPGARAVVVSVPRRVAAGGVLLAITLDPAGPDEPRIAFLRTCATMLGAAADRAETDARLRQAQKMEAVGQLAGSVAHDFNNLLTGILGSAELATAELGPDHPARPLLADVSKAGEHAALLTRQLLAFSRKDQLRPEVVDVRGVMVGLSRILGRLMGEHVELRVTQPDAPVRLLADRGALEQIVLNLCLNARDAVGPGGHISVEVGTRPGPDAGEIGPDGELVFLAVEDDGCGMDVETRARIFEPFFTTKGPEHGTGLGLATVRALAREFDGEISVTSEVGRGSRFEVWFPQATRLTLEEADAGAGGPSSGGGEVVLLVEDHTLARRAIERVLTGNGYRVRSAGDGVEALEVLGRHDDVSVVVSDLTMPRMGGAELQQHMARLGIRVPIVFLSGYPAGPGRDRPLTPEAHAPILAKPVATDELLRVLRAVIEAPPVVERSGGSG